MSLSEDLRNELAAITPRRECDVLAELSGLAHTAGTVHLLGGRRVSVHFDLASSAVARRGFSLLRTHSTGRRATSCTFPEWIMRSRCCTRPVSSRRDSLRWSGRPRVSSPGAAAVARTSAGPCSARDR